SSLSHLALFARPGYDGRRNFPCRTRRRSGNPGQPPLTDGGDMNAVRNPGRVAGLWYLLLVLGGPLRLIYIPNKLFVHGDASASIPIRSSRPRSCGGCGSSQWGPSHTSRVSCHGSSAFG